MGNIRVGEGRVKYITGKFDSASILFNRFLALDTLKDQNPKMNSSAINLSIKCDWLARLPENSFDLGRLREDPDRYAGIEVLIGDIALELGKAATEVTGKLGYEYAGIFASFATKLFGKSSKY